MYTRKKSGWKNIESKREEKERQITWGYQLLPLFASVPWRSGLSFTDDSSLPQPPPHRGFCWMFNLLKTTKHEKQMTIEKRNQKTNNGGTWGDFGGTGASSSNGGCINEGLMNGLSPRDGEVKASRDVGDWSSERPGTCDPIEGDVLGYKRVPFEDCCCWVGDNKDVAGERAGSWGEVER